MGGHVTMSVDYRKPVEVVDKDEPEDVYEALLVRPLKGWFNSAIVVWSVNGTIEHANTFDGNGQPVRGGCGYFVRNTSMATTYRDKPTYRDADGSSIYPVYPLEPTPGQYRWFNPITKEWEYFE